MHSLLCASVYLPCVPTLVLLEKPTHCGSALGFHNDILRYHYIFINFMQYILILFFLVLSLYRNQKNNSL